MRSKISVSGHGQKKKRDQCRGLKVTLIATLDLVLRTYQSKCAKLIFYFFKCSLVTIYCYSQLIYIQEMLFLHPRHSFHCFTCNIIILQRVKWPRYRPGVAQRVGRSITLLFRDRGTRRGWMVSSTLRPHFTPGKDPVPILQEAGWTPGPVWTGGKSRPHRNSILDRPAPSQSLYRLSYPVHNIIILLL